MDLGTAAVIVGIAAGVVGIVAGVIYIVETVCKDGPAILRKATTFKSFETFERSSPFFDQRGTSFAIPQIARDLAVMRPELRALLLKNRQERPPVTDHLQLSTASPFKKTPIGLQTANALWELPDSPGRPPSVTRQSRQRVFKKISQHLVYQPE